MTNRILTGLLLALFVTVTVVMFTFGLSLMLLGGVPALYEFVQAVLAGEYDNLRLVEYGFLTSFISIFPGMISVILADGLWGDDDG